ncbi:MAG TPA: phosphatidylserine decarboxylase, partial [Phycisphaeraceae bacterium]
MLSAYARKEWLTNLAIGLLLSFTLSVVGLWWLAILMVIATIAAIAFFRDPERRIPTQRGAIVAPADGRISSIHNLEHFEPLDGPAVC